MSHMNTPLQSWADPKTGECPVAQTLQLIGGKHGPRVLHCLFQNEMHFLELVRALDGISRKVLRAQLRDFEDNGLVIREQKEDARRRVGYSLSVKGRALGGILAQVYAWSQHFEHVERGDEAVTTD